VLDFWIKVGRFFPRVFHPTHLKKFPGGGFMAEGTGGFLLLPKNITNLYPEQKI
jgi:hypothetical protein